MLFNNNAVIRNLWVRELNFNEGKLQFVPGRPFHSLSLRLSGKVRFEIDGKSYSSAQNDITFMPAGMSYHTQVQQSGSMLLVHFETDDCTLNAQPIFQGNRPDLRILFSELCEKYSLDECNYFHCMSLFYAILANLSNPQQAIPRRLQLAKKQIDTQFSDPISIASLANESGISEVHFRNEFRRYYGMSPLSYLKQVRISNARQLLRSGYYTVTDVALACGFESISYFSYEFKRLTGITPTEFLKNSAY